MAAQFQTLKGMLDVLPPESARYERLVATFAGLVERAGYALVITPVVEDYALFQRVGESTDVVRKEMYDFDDKGGRHITLRPEGTAPVVRTYLQHRPTPPYKAWYVAPNFRYEQPQAGRYRQHFQIGVEAIGADDPDLDVEVVATLASLYRQLGLTRVTLLLNSLGDATCRPPYRQMLLDYLEARRGELCPEHQERLTENPLRVLDCKKPQCRAATADAPHQVDHLCDDCAQHFDRVKRGLDALGIAYELAPRLVRGLDYYTRTTFEFAAGALESAQNAIGGGGRYDGLAEALGGPPTPGIGFGAGIERILLACDAEGTFPTPETSPSLDVFVIDTTGGEQARDITHALRGAGVAADRAFDNRSFKAQMKQALRSGARFAIAIDPDHIELRTLQEKGEAERLDLGTLVDHVRKRLHP
ncbi:MAG TPA: histidine--tRNA ligase [Acidimicrobiales bacterium]|nr:histidine--tRNA ligase [Acidimicrobiales bacterium]